jgi:hypothetical protein
MEVSGAGLGAGSEAGSVLGNNRSGCGSSRSMNIRILRTCIRSTAYGYIICLENCAVVQVLVAWFDFLVKNPELGLTADLIVYLKTSPEVSLTG